jgi:hypothetical protein
MYNFADSSVTASAFTSGANTALTLVATTAGLTTTAALVIYFDDQLTSTTVTVSSLPAISGTVTIGSALPTGTNRIGVVTIGAGTVTIGAGTAQIGSVTLSSFGTAFDAQFTDSQAGGIVRTALYYQDTEWYPVGVDNGLPVSVGNLVSLNPLPAGTSQIGSVTASISNFPATQAISIASVTIGNSITISSLPALAAGTAQIGSVTASISNSVTIGSLPAISGTVTANTFALQGTAVTTSNFTSTTASTVLANYNATREVLTIFNEGAGLLFVCPGALCTTTAYQVRLSSGDYYEVPNHQTTITHSAVFATAGTARVTQVS